MPGATVKGACGFLRTGSLSRAVRVSSLVERGRRAMIYLRCLGSVQAMGVEAVGTLWKMIERFSASSRSCHKRLEGFGIAWKGRKPYKGTPEAFQEIVAGRTHLMIAPPLAVMPMYETKQVKVLAVTGTERLASMPEVPTLKESGIPFSAYAWLGVCAASGIPQPVVDLLSNRIVQVVNSADYRALVEKSGSVAVSSTAPEFRALIEETANDAAPIFREFGVQLD